MRRRLRIVALWLVVALVATVLIAWAAAATARVSSREIQNLSEVVDGSVRWTVRVLELPAGRRIESVRQRGLPWSPEQATGAPDTTGTGDLQTAWASLTQDDQDEWLELTYAHPITVTAIHVYETYNPGALAKATVRDSAGNEVIVWEQSNPPPATQTGGVAILPVRRKLASDRVRLYLDSKRVKGWNEIDAVGLKEAQGNLHWAKSATASSTYARADNAGAASPRIVLSSWATSLTQPTAAFAAGDAKTERRAIDARGWPLVAMSGEVDPGRVTLALPLRPIWTGMVGDILIFAAAMGAIWWLAVGLRRFIVESLRLRRGLCMCCGYDLRFDLADGCPECGWRRAPATTTAPSAPPARPAT